MKGAVASGRGKDASTEAAIWNLLERVPDPEIPVLSVIDLGIVRHVRLSDDGAIEVGVTPTYSGCPATEVIRGSIEQALRNAGHTDARIVDVLSPPWTSDWITPAGREKLRRFGIAPPATAVASPRQLFHQPRVEGNALRGRHHVGALRARRPFADRGDARAGHQQQQQLIGAEIERGDALVHRRGRPGRAR